MAVLTAGSLTLGAGLALAATAESQAPEAAKTPAASKATTPGENKAKDTKAVQQTEKARAMRKKGEREKAVDPIVRGEVTAVEPTAKTLTVKAMRGKTAAQGGTSKKSY